MADRHGGLKRGDQLLSVNGVKNTKIQKLLKLGTGHVNRSDEFSEKFRKGGGVIFNPKIYIAKFLPVNRAF